MRHWSGGMVTVSGTEAVRSRPLPPRSFNRRLKFFTLGEVTAPLCTLGVVTALLAMLRVCTSPFPSARTAYAPLEVAIKSASTEMNKLGVRCRAKLRCVVMESSSGSHGLVCLHPSLLLVRGCDYAPAVSVRARAASRPADGSVSLGCPGSRGPRRSRAPRLVRERPPRGTPQRRGPPPGGPRRRLAPRGKRCPGQHDAPAARGKDRGHRWLG